MNATNAPSPETPADHGEREQAASASESGSGSGSSRRSLSRHVVDADRSFRCPCCLRLRSSLDRHHWAYPSEDGFGVTLRLCRSCHDAIHGGHRVAVQRRRSPTTDWRDDALARLIARHRAVWGHQPPRGLARWYNIPVSDDRILHAIPRSLDPRIVEAATPDPAGETDTETGGTGGTAAETDAASVPTSTPMNPDP